MHLLYGPEAFVKPLTEAESTFAKLKAKRLRKEIFGDVPELSFVGTYADNAPNAMARHRARQAARILDRMQREEALQQFLVEISDLPRPKRERLQLILTRCG